MRELTVWITPFTALDSVSSAIARCKQLAHSVSSSGRQWHANVLLPTHFGVYPQSQCNQTLPPDLCVSSPDDVDAIRQRFEGEGLGFGVWGVPYNEDSGEVAGQYAAAGGYYAANFEPGVFWLPGDDGAAIDRWWGVFWNGRDALDGSVIATVVPNGWGLGAFTNSMGNLAGGCSGLAIECYGGPNTPEYPYPSLWPEPSATLTRSAAPGSTIIPILATANLTAQIAQASRIASGNVHVWAI